MICVQCHCILLTFAFESFLQIFGLIGLVQNLEILEISIVNSLTCTFVSVPIYSIIIDAHEGVNWNSRRGHRGRNRDLQHDVGEAFHPRFAHHVQRSHAKAAAFKVSHEYCRLSCYGECESYKVVGPTLS